MKRFLSMGLILAGLSWAARPAAAAQTVVSLGFDDGFADELTAATVLNQYGLKATFYIISGRIGRAGYMTQNDVLALQASGHEVGGHTVDHLDLATLSSTDQQHQICDDKATLTSWGLTINSLAYPFGSYNNTSRTTAAGCGYLDARTVGSLGCSGCPAAEPIPPVDAFVVRTPNSIKADTTLAQMQKFVTDAEQSGGGWVPLVFHHVCNNCDGPTGYSISSTTLNAFASWLAARQSQGTVVKTAGEVMGALPPAVPTIASLTPNSATVGGAGFSLTVQGTNFTTGSVVRWNGASRTTQFVNANTLTATIPASDIATSGVFPITVLDGSLVSNAQNFLVNAGGVAPSTYTIFSTTVPPAGNSSRELNGVNLGVRWRSDVDGNVTGMRFYKFSFSTGTHVGTLWSATGTKLAEATFTGETASGWQTIPFSNPVAVTAGTTYIASYWTNTGYAVTTNFFAVNFDNPPLHAPASVTGALNGLYRYSAAVAFPTSSTNKSNYWADVLFNVPDNGPPPTPNPVPTLTSLSPSSTTAGGSTFTLGVMGSNFVNGSVVRWNGGNRTTTFISSSSLSATILASDLSSPGTATVTVFNPTPGGGLSNGLSFTIAPAPPVPNPVPTLTSVSPSSTTSGSGGTTLTLIGTGFVSTSTVLWNGSPRATTFVTSTTLRAAILATDVVSPTVAALSVFNAAPGGGTSNSISFSVVPAPPTQLIVSVTFDDGFGDEMLGAQLLDQYGMKGTFYINSAQIGVPGYMTVANLQSLQVNGHEIGGHTLHHPNLTTLSASQQQTEICDDRTALINWGLSVRSFAYPYGAFNNAIKSVVQGCGYTNARGAWGLDCSSEPCVEPIPPTDPYWIRTAPAIESTTTLDQMKQYVLNAEQAGGGWLPLQFHHVCNGCDQYAVTFSTLESFLSWLRDRSTVGTVVKTVDQVISGIPTNPAPTLTSITPTSATVGTSSVTLTLTGTGFISSSTVRWNGTARATTFTSSTTLTAVIPGSDLVAVGTFTVTVMNPSPGGGISAGRNFVVHALPITPNPAPTLTSISPSSSTAGSSGFTLTATGSNFVSSSTIRWNGSTRATSFVNSTTLTASIPNSDVVNVGTATITVFTPSPGGGISAGLNLVIHAPPPTPNPVPVLNSLSPDEAVAGSPGFTLRVTGSNFFAGSVVRWNGADRTTSFVNGTTLDAAIPSADVVAVGTVTVTVFNPAPGGGVSAGQNFVIHAIPPTPNPVPVIASVSPSSVTAGGTAFTLTVTGSQFVSNSTVLWNGNARGTTFINSGTLNAAISAGDISARGIVSISVFNPAPGGGTSATREVWINLVPVAQSLSPASALVGTSSLTVTINGTNFASDSIARWNGSDRTTTFVSSTQLRMLLTSTDLGTVTTAAISVLNPAPGGTSGSLSFQVTAQPSNPVPVLNSISPTSANVGGQGFLLTASGSSFVAESVVYWNGSPRSTSFISNTSLRATIPASDLATRGVVSVTVVSPVPGGGTSVGRAFSVNLIPALNSLNPNTAVAGGVAFTLTVQGSNFAADSIVRWNSNNRPTTFVSPTELQAAISAGDIRKRGNDTITVLNPAPGGVSNGLTFTTKRTAGSLALDTVDAPVLFVDFNLARVYPNPWRANQHGTLQMTFDRMPEGSTVKIFTVAGHWVKTLSAVSGTATWDLTTEHGNPAASGYYYYVVTGPNDQRVRGTLAIIR